MTSVLNLSYEKLRNEGLFEEEDGYYDDLREKVIGRQRTIARFRFFRKVHVRKRLKIRIPGLGRLLIRKARLVKLGWRKVVSRLKESQSHFGDLFAGNYLFMQVSPTPLKAHVRKSLQSYPVADLSSSSARFSLAKVV